MGERTGSFNGAVDSFQRWSVGFRIGVEEDHRVRVLHFGCKFGRKLMYTPRRHTREQVRNAVGNTVVGAQPIADRDD